MQVTAVKSNRVTKERKGPILLMGLNRPEKRNAFDLEMMNELALAYTELEQDNNLRCGVLFAHGEHFTGGLDLPQVIPIMMEKNELPTLPNTIDPWNLKEPQRKKPIVCAVQGYCLTLGIELMLAADIVVAANNTRFAQIEIKRGIFPFGGATIRLVQAMGWGNAMRYLLTGDEFNAADAYRMGLVQEIVDIGEQLTKAIDIAETIAKQAPLGVYATLASARKAVAEGPQAAVNDLLATVLKLMHTKDAQEGMQSFLEKRPANFIGE